MVDTVKVSSADTQPFMSDPIYPAVSDALIAKRNFTHCFLKGAVEPAVVDHILDGDWWILQVLK